jgi:hypothetical protein
MDLNVNAIIHLKISPKDQNGGVNCKDAVNAAVYEWSYGDAAILTASSQFI